MLLRTFKSQQHLPECVTSGAEALRFIEGTTLDGIVLFDSLPDMNGTSFLEALRAGGSTVPALVYTEQYSVSNCARILDAGADDCIAAPPAQLELCARVRAMLRRRANYIPDLLTVGALTLNRSSYTLQHKGLTAQISGKEFRIIETLMEHPQFTVTSEQLITHVWGQNCKVNSSVIWVHVSNIRRVLKNLNAPVEIRFIRGAGYTLIAQS